MAVSSSSKALPISADSFVPHPEFTQQIPSRQTPLTFCLLSLIGSSYLRLSRFPQQTVHKLKSLLERRLETEVDIPVYHHADYAELSLPGKPWSTPKEAHTERLLVDILALLLAHGFALLSTLEYGRPKDSHLAVAFSHPKSSTATSNAPTTAFAISFPSSSVLRVVAPPRQLTPAILQAVRAAWPRGVVAEKTVADSVFEFRLRGARAWFREGSEAAAQDALSLVLQLLNSLDLHSFSLLASLPLGARSGSMRDIWLFASHAPPRRTSWGSTYEAPILAAPGPSFPPTPTIALPTPHFPNSKPPNNHYPSPLLRSGSSASSHRFPQDPSKSAPTLLRKKRRVATPTLPATTERINRRSSLPTPIYDKLSTKSPPPSVAPSTFNGAGPSRFPPHNITHFNTLPNVSYSPSARPISSRRHSLDGSPNTMHAFRDSKFSDHRAEVLGTKLGSPVPTAPPTESSAASTRSTSTRSIASSHSSQRTITGDVRPHSRTMQFALGARARNSPRNRLAQQSNNSDGYTGWVLVDHATKPAISHASASAPALSVEREREKERARELEREHERDREREAAPTPTTGRGLFARLRHKSHSEGK